jgi:hypothetical protein
MAILPTDIRILFTNYDIITYFLNLASCSEHFIIIKHRILATFNINKKKSILRACMPLNAVCVEYLWHNKFDGLIFIILALKCSSKKWHPTGSVHFKFTIIMETDIRLMWNILCSLLLLQSKNMIEYKMWHLSTEIKVPFNCRL